MSGQSVAFDRLGAPVGDPLQDGPLHPGQVQHHAPVWMGPPHAAGGMLAVPSHPAFERMLARMPLNIRQSLTPEQLAALARATLPTATRHALDYRISLPFFGRRYYLAVLGGRERRTRARLLQEGQLVVSRITAAYSIGLAILTALAVLAVAGVLYIVKSLLGVDLLADQSALHDMMTIWP